jgi:Ca2+-binding RTX toxin-like protein
MPRGGHLFLAGTLVAVLAIGAAPSFADPASGEQSHHSPCTVKGTAGDDRLRGTRHADVICARAGDDQVVSRGGDDQVRGGAGNDVVQTQAGADRVSAGPGADRVAGGDGDDAIYGESEIDVLAGDAGDDYLDGGPGADYLDGGLGIDQCLRELIDHIRSVCYHPAEVENVVLTPATPLDTSQADQDVTVAMEIAEGELPNVGFPGVKLVSLFIRLPDDSYGVDGGWMYRVSGDEMDGWYVGTFTLPQGSVPGRYGMSVQITAGLGTFTTKPSDLRARGLIDAIEQVGAAG